MSSHISRRPSSPPDPRDVNDGYGRLSDTYYRALATVIGARVGIQLPVGKTVMVEGRLRRRLRALDLPNFDAYGRLLFEEGGLDDEWAHLVDCMTTNKTDFFREPDHFDILVRTCVPALAGRTRGMFKVWSAASSNGAEAYTIAMVLSERAREHALGEFMVLGTDISTEVLREAKLAVYTREMAAGIPAAYRTRYVMDARDAGRDAVRIVPELRSRTRFEHMNLMEQPYPVDRDVDVIFCRNVLIYFDKPTQRKIVAGLASHLKPNGFLLLGHAESMAGGEVPGLRQIVPAVFQRSVGASRRAA